MNKLGFVTVAVFHTTEVAVPDTLATGHIILGLDVRLISTVRLAGGKTRVALSNNHSKTMLLPTGNKGGLAVFCLGCTMDRRLTGRRGSITELGPMMVELLVELPE